VRLGWISSCSASRAHWSVQAAAASTSLNWNAPSATASSAAAQDQVAVLGGAARGRRPGSTSVVVRPMRYSSLHAVEGADEPGEVAGEAGLLVGHRARVVDHEQDVDVAVDVDVDDRLRGTSILLVLDLLERVVEATAEQGGEGRRWIRCWQ
jgi:hypothetical protein